jgi:protein involved in polysaccharide export with SLBB domain/GT2 family glycosyltransferase
MTPPDIDIVVIGLNCERTLADCLRSALASDYRRGRIRVFYVDSGSNDGSVAAARAFPEVTVLSLEGRPPSPGAARNLGWRAGTAPYVQFLDSDTVMDAEWPALAVESLTVGIGAVRGWRQERYPERSVYNWIGDQEWNARPGDCDTFGGDAMLRREVLEQTGGYDEELVGGEDPELSERVRRGGWRVVQVPAPMTVHDLAMHRFGQYWKRAYRTGYGYAAVLDRRDGGSGFWNREVVRIALRGGVAPFGALAGLLGGLAGWAPGLVVLTLALAAWFHPVLFRRDWFRKEMGLTAREAWIYGLHCSVVVLPEFFGLARFVVGKLADRPLRNSAPALPAAAQAAAWILCALPWLGGCSMFDPGVHDYTQGDGVRESRDASGAFLSGEAKEAVIFASEADVATFSSLVPDEYLIGPGDVMSIIVRGRPDVSLEEVTVSPDGKISMPRVGIVEVRDQTVDWLTAFLTEKLSAFYSGPDVSVLVKEYHNNKVFVLGRVDHPGLVNFKGTGTLLEAIALAGGMSTVAQNSFLSQAVIFRGKEMVIWVDLTELLNNGNMALNAKLKNNDLVYIPESHDELAYVMGEVANPGAIKLTSELSLLDAIMMSGGPTVNGKLARVYLIRFKDKKGHVQEIDLTELLGTADFRKDYLLRDGDVVYVSPRVLRDVNYVISSLSPSVSYLSLAALAAQSGGN